MKLRLLNNIILLRNAFVSTRRETGASLMILLLVTLVFTFIMWLAESGSNPDYSFWDALVWVIVKYVDDPADVVTAPVTILGQVIGTLVGILGIAIFAVPAGLIGSGLLDAMAEEKEMEKVSNHSKQLHKRFRRIAQSASHFRNNSGKVITLKRVPRYRSFPHIIMKTGMTNDEIIAAINNCPDMRLMNTAATHPIEAQGQDNLVVVHFPLNNEYGCMLDRGSDVTIVAPVALTELGTGNFAFSLAAMGGFNYVSRELSPNPDDPFGFYSMQKSKLNLIGDSDTKEEVKSQALHFMADLRELKERSEKAGRTHWFIFIVGTTKSAQDQVYMWRLATDNAEMLPSQVKGDIRYGSTVRAENEEQLQHFYDSVREVLGKYSVVVGGTKQPISVSLDNNGVLKSISTSNIMCRLGGGVSCNSLTLRIGYEILLHSSQNLIIAKDIAEALKSIIEPDKEISEQAQRCYLKEGDGFADDHCKTEVFESDPEALRKMIKQKSKEARKRFEHIDLDGNEI